MEDVETYGFSTALPLPRNVQRNRIDGHQQPRNRHCHPRGGRNGSEIYRNDASSPRISTLNLQLSWSTRCRLPQRYLPSSRSGAIPVCSSMVAMYVLRRRSGVSSVLMIEFGKQLSRRFSSSFRKYSPVEQKLSKEYMV